MPLIYRGQTYTTSNQLAPNNRQAISYRGQSYQPCCPPYIVSPKVTLVYRGVPYEDEEDYSNATEMARMFGFCDHQIALSCPLEG